MLRKYIENSGLSLSQIEGKMKQNGLSTNKAYISKLQNGVAPPAGEEITRALAEVTGGDPEALLLAGHIEKAPEEVRGVLSEVKKFNSLFFLLKSLGNFISYYRENHRVHKDFLSHIRERAWAVEDNFKFNFDYEQLTHDPLYAAEIIQQIKHYYFPLSDSITIGTEQFDFQDFLGKEHKLLDGQTEFPSWATSKDKRDIKKILEEDLPVMFDGKPVDDEDRQRIADLITGFLWDAKEKNKKTYGRKKNTKKDTSDDN